MAELYYAGIGSRQTPIVLKQEIKAISLFLLENDYILRSGGADGADSFFEEAIPPSKKEIFLPWKNYNGNTSAKYGVSKEAMAIASKYHPVWCNLSDPVKKIMARNVYQILGEDLESEVKFVVCWTPNGEKTGGTAQAIRIAESLNIPIINMFSPDWKSEVKKLVEWFSIND